METLNRIRELMKKQGIMDVEIERMLELPQGQFSNWKRGRGKSYYEHIERIADRLGVTIDFLIRGQDDASDTLTGQEKKLVMNYRELSDRGKKVITANIELLAEGRKQNWREEVGS